MKSTEGTSRPRKRSRTSDNADNAPAAFGGKKARGRPRVDTEDATAADVSLEASNLSMSCCVFHSYHFKEG